MDVREVIGPMEIERHNMYPSTRITANLPAGVPLAEARSLCEKLATHVLDTKEFKLIWRTR
jgi:multidrug efflux pump subunit AcrB